MFSFVQLALGELKECQKTCAYDNASGLIVVGLGGSSSHVQLHRGRQMGIAGWVTKQTVRKDYVRHQRMSKTGHCMEP